MPTVSFSLDAPFSTQCWSAKYWGQGRRGGGGAGTVTVFVKDKPYKLTPMVKFVLECALQDKVLGEK